MKLLILIAIACAVLLNAVYAQNTTCPNAAVAASTNFAGVPFAFTANTLPNTVCPALNNQPSCCPDNVIIAVQSAFTQARVRVLAAKAQMDLLRQRTVVINAQMESLRNQIQTNLNQGKITQQQATALTNLVNNIENAIVTFINAATNAFVKCLSSILTYLAGVVCFGCDTNWRTYTIIYNNGTIVLVINSATCDAMNGGCIDFYLSFVQLLVNLQNAGAQFARDLGINVNVVPTWSNPCHSNNTADTQNLCKNFICQQLVGGANTNNPSFDTSSRHGLQKDLHEAHKSLKNVFSHIEDHIGASDLAKQMLEEAMSVVTIAHDAHRETTEVLRQSSNQQSTYSSSGVDLYQLGSQSSLDKSASSPASQLSVATFLFVFISFIAIMF